MKQKQKPLPKKLEVQTLEPTKDLENVTPVEVKVLESNTDEPKLFEGKKMYWFRPMHFGVLGKVTGLILNGHWDTFIKTAPDNIDIFKWISSVDKEAEKLAEVKRKMKLKIGLKED